MFFVVLLKTSATYTASIRTIEIILMDRGWGFDLDSVVMMDWSYRECLLYALYCALGDSCYLCSVAHRLTCFEIADD